MTTLVAWAAADKAGHTAIYLASDSKFTWPNLKKWNYGRKLYVTKKAAILFGYTGDVLFPSIFLGQLVESLESLNDHPKSAQELADAVVPILATSLAAYPSEPGVVSPGFQILAVMSIKEGVYFRFQCLIFEKMAGPRTELLYRILSIPDRGVFFVGGSGKSSYEKRLYSASREAGGFFYNDDGIATANSKASFWALADVVNNNDDVYTGGPLQMVGAFRNGLMQSFGHMRRGSHYHLGLQLPKEVAVNLNVTWHNDRMEVMDPATGELKIGAQKQPRK
ncbi:hypothetical protein LAJ19_03300 [Deinococcus taeanensis]|uniref:hypothetical protein n=1 Tax=Deinococcus taeanensis TaxID=2737050 RepID=UPI001CDCBEE8|nr:hypothetical protein [Deinococcus taeanensis]UBV43257.1 hypothetical protein LAJ19_03300 [Deinococcus taeanensis]